tara:strand:+ start:984 stop:1166 length:183 start_codon:yes stop_codon:yes gene_type:complete
MKRKQIHTKPSAKKLREQILDLSVDLEYAGRVGDSAYAQEVNKKLDKLYTMLEEVASRAS